MINDGNATKRRVISLDTLPDVVRTLTEGVVFELTRPQRLPALRFIPTLDPLAGWFVNGLLCHSRVARLELLA